MKEFQSNAYRSLSDTCLHNEQILTCQGVQQLPRGKSGFQVNKFKHVQWVCMLVEGSLDWGGCPQVNKFEEYIQGVPYGI